ncbi:biotin--[acetyl-CoA-carboxylase] ligase [Peptacetobacter sp.]|uniref:biotin--[acetyl-CoA-carboxylase] ligase n=1 Tax=Peptacetobacter sp. TaxID=2991975 RepID=UPI002625790D|nr:biotin--[acetyl-CoA-carboxylase] ligase [Peptacetobacter sp.]
MPKENRKKIIDMLSNAGDTFISGESISKELGISRAAVWKHINYLKENGYRIEAINKRGYRIIDLDSKLIIPEQITMNLNTKIVGKNIKYMQSVDSTNNYCRKNASSLSDGSIVIAEYQSEGKGRLGKNWQSNLGEGIWMSLIVKPNIPVYKAPFLTLVAGAAILNAFEKLGIKTKIKWPNDIILNDKKVCGILTEMIAEVEKVDSIIIGIGINVNTMEFPGELSEKATSLKKEGIEINRVEIISEFIKEFEKLYISYIELENKKEIVDICKKNSILIGKIVYLIKDNKKEKVKCIDINEDGNLIVEHMDGNIEEVYSGEVSIRGQKGYI